MNTKRRAGNSESKLHRLLASKGFYIILIVCISIAGTSAAIRNMSKSTLTQMETSMNDEEWTKTTDGVKSGGTQRKPVTVTKSSTAAVEPVAEGPNVPVPKAEATPKATEEPENTTKNTPMQPPVTGKVLVNYSNEGLVFSRTMGDWRAHRGIDIEANPGTQVKAVSDGTVETVHNDNLLGVTVVIDHGNGTKSIYGNLQSSDFISEGTSVKAGDVIGGVGKTEVSECLDSPHLHFEVTVNGVHSNPLDFIDPDVRSM